MRGAGDAGVEGAHHPPNSAFQLQVDTVSGNIAFRGHFQSALDRQHIMHGRDDEFRFGKSCHSRSGSDGLRDRAALPPAPSPHRPRGGIRHIRILGVQVFFQQLAGQLDGVDPASMPRHRSKSRMGWAGWPEFITQAAHVGVRAADTHATGHVGAGQRISTQSHHRQSWCARHKNNPFSSKHNSLRNALALNSRQHTPSGVITRMMEELYRGQSRSVEVI